MTNLYLIKVGYGKVTHVAYDFEGAYVTSVSTYCGTDAGQETKSLNRTSRVKLNTEVNENTITCKKCLKRYLKEMKAETPAEKSLEDMTKEELIAMIREMQSRA